MIHKKSLAVLLGSALLLQACGGSMLGSSDAEDYKMTPEPVTDDPTKARPSANAPVIKTDGIDLRLADGQAILLRGANLLFGDDPLNSIHGIKAIRETGSNVVRLQLRADTSAQNLEAALNQIVEHNLVAVLSLWEPEPQLYCSDDDTAINKAVADLWLNRWLPVIAQDRYQPSLMINIASGWGPKDIFDGYSIGYRTYIDTYKTLIRQFRRAGFNVPLVIDAPGCGADYHAFVSGRGKELLAADEKKNLVLSVHGFGAPWNSASKIISAVGQLQSQNLPVVMSEFGGSGLGGSPIPHMAVLEKGLGDVAAVLDIPWQSPTDKLAINVPFDAVVDVNNTEISYDIFVDAGYAADQNMGIVLYLRDVNDAYAGLPWEGIGSFTPGDWQTRKYTVKSRADFGWAADDFDMSQVAKIGVELVANNKPAEIGGLIKVDNFKVVDAGGGSELANYTFDGDTQGWGDGWAGHVAHQDGALAIHPGDSGEGIAAIWGLSSVVDFSEPVKIKARVFVPAEYQGSWIYFQFFTTEPEWTQTADLGGGDFNYGGWTDIELDAHFPGSGSLGIQLGGVTEGSPQDPGFRGPVLVDDIVLVGAEAASDFETGTQYHGSFDNGEDGWAYISWGAAADVVAADGVLSISPKDGSGTRIDVQKNNLSSVEFLNLNDPFTLKTRVFIPAYYQDKSLTLQFYMQDVEWSHHFDAIHLTGDELVYGDWNEFNLEVEFPEGFNRNGVPKHLGFSFNTEGGVMSPSEPFLIDEVIFEGLIPVEKEEVIRQLVDFFYLRHLTNLAVDYVDANSLLQPEDLEGRLSAELRSKPFHWIAWAWFGNSAEYADWDMTLSVDDVSHLTERGEEIVNGKGGIRQQ